MSLFCFLSTLLIRPVAALRRGGAALLLSGLLAACQGPSSPETATAPVAAKPKPAAATVPNELTLSPAQVRAAGITVGGFTYQNVTASVQANGLIDVPPHNHATISAVLGGYVQAVRVLPGQLVAKGSVVATLRHPDYLKLQQEYLQGRARLTFLQQDLQRQQTLAAEEVGARRKLEQAQADYATEQAAVRSLAEQLRLIGITPARLTARSITPTVALTTPIAGYVRAVSMNPGQFVNPQDVLVEIVDRSDLHLELKVFEKDIAQVQKGQQVLFKLPNSGTTTEHKARIFLVGKAFDPEARTVSVHAHLESDDAALLPGQYVAARIQTAGARQRTLPEDAVLEAGAISYVFVQLKAGPAGATFRRVKVKTGPVQDGDVAITPLEPIPDSTQLVRSGAYFLEAELTKDGE